MSVTLAVLVALLFGAPYVGDFDVGGASVMLFRDTAVLVACAIFVLSRRSALSSALSQSPPWLLTLSIFAAYLLCQSLASPYGQLNSGLVLRQLCLPAAALLFLCVRDPACDLKALSILVAMYCIISIAATPFYGEYLEGPLGRHYSKFVALTGVCLSVAMWITNRHRRYAVICGLLSVVAGLLCLQRGFLIASAVAVAVAVAVAKVRSQQKLQLGGAAIAIAAMAFFFVGDRLVEYAFYEDRGPAELFSSILDGTFELSMLRTRARLDLTDILISNSNVSFLGHGGGWAKNLIGVYYGEGKEPHNDTLMLLYDYGVLGVVLFATFSVTFFCRAARLSRIESSAPLGIAAAGLFCGCVAWMFFSNVLIYAMGGVIFAVILLAMAEMSRRPRIAS